MAQDNTITVVGNLTRDPELRYTTAGNAHARLGIAVNRRWFNKATNEYDEEVSFFNITAWGELAEHVADTVDKGNRVVVVGRLEQRSWETDEGEKRSVVEIIADEVAPSLRWATAGVKRITRETVGGSRPDADGYDEEPI